MDTRIAVLTQICAYNIEAQHDAQKAGCLPITFGVFFGKNCQLILDFVLFIQNFFESFIAQLLHS